MIRGYRLQEVVDAGWAPSVRWLKEGIRSGKVPGYRVPRSGRGGRGGEFRMTGDDIKVLIERARVTPPAPSRSGLNLTRAGEKRLLNQPWRTA